MQEKCPSLCSVEFFHNACCYPHLGDFNQPGGEQHLDMVLDPGRVFAKLSAKLGQRGRRVHQPAQDSHTPRISE